MCLSEAKTSHAYKMWTEVSSSIPHFLQMGLLLSPITYKYLLRALCPVRRPITGLNFVLLKDNNWGLVARLRPEIIYQHTWNDVTASCDSPSTYGPSTLCSRTLRDCLFVFGSSKSCTYKWEIQTSKSCTYKWEIQTDTLSELEKYYCLLECVWVKFSQHTPTIRAVRVCTVQPAEFCTLALSVLAACNDNLLQCLW